VKAFRGISSHFYKSPFSSDKRLISQVAEAKTAIQAAQTGFEGGVRLVFSGKVSMQYIGSACCTPLLTSLLTCSL
jgi:hypothetical protein